MRIRLNGLLFDGTGAEDPTYTIELDGVEGLFGGPGVRAKTVARPNAHGNFALPIFRDARSIKINGLVFSDGLYAQQKDLLELGGVLADGEVGRLEISADAGEWWCMVGLADAPDVQVVVPGRIARYQLVLRAVDPRLYGVQQSFAGSSVTAHHYGNFPASPVVEVVGPRSAPYTITGPGGRKVTVSQSLTASQTHRIDFASGGVFRNGSRQMGVLTHFQPWTVPPGRRVSMSISSGSMTVLVDDTYM